MVLLSTRNSILAKRKKFKESKTKKKKKNTTKRWDRFWIFVRVVVLVCWFFAFFVAFCVESFGLSVPITSPY